MFGTGRNNHSVHDTSDNVEVEFETNRGAIFSARGRLWGVTFLAENGRFQRPCEEETNKQRQMRWRDMIKRDSEWRTATKVMQPTNPVQPKKIKSGMELWLREQPIG